MICRKHQFELPDGVIYLDGNSLGPLVGSVATRVHDAIREEWGQQLIGGWNDSGWMEQPRRVGDMIAHLIGAPQGSVVMGDTLSIKIYQALAACLAMRPERKVILSDTGNFPSDLYMAEGLAHTLGRGHVLRKVDPQAVIAAIDETVAAVMITEVDYRTGRRHDMHAITRRAHEAGAMAIWDLAHSAGALPVDLEGSGCDFAAGCSYKYLNGGPGAPGFIYVRPDLVDRIEPALSGWMGHAEPFAFDLGYRPGAAVERMRVGTPPVLQLTALEDALSVWSGIDMDDLRAESLRLGDLFANEVGRACPQLALVTPQEPQQRGSQISFQFEHGYEAMQAVISEGVIGDFRAPDIMRFGITPLYIDDADIIEAARRIEVVMSGEKWRDPKFAARSRVT